MEVSQCQVSGLEHAYQQVKVLATKPTITLSMYNCLKTLAFQHKLVSKKSTDELTASLPAQAF